MNVHPPSDSYAYRLDALARLAAARSVVDAVLIGHWDADPDILDLVATLVTQAADSSRWAAAAGCRAA